MIGQAGVVQMPVPANNIFPGYWGNKPRYIVIHKTASGGSPQDIANFFQHDPNQASSHYIVGQDGTIVQCVSESDGAGANGVLQQGHAPFLPTNINLNLLTISIEHVDPTDDNSTPLTDAQKSASFKLIKGICERHNIPMRAGDAAGGIIGHKDISPISRARCPGNYPWQELFTYLKTGEDTSVQTYSPDSPSFASWFSANKKGDVWTCKSNKKTVAFGILGLYKQLSPDGKSLPLPGLPLTGELSLTIKGVKVVVQIFERMVLVYDPTHALDSQPGLEDAYIAHLDNPELLKLIPGLTLGNGGVNPAIVASAKTANLAIADLFEKLGISG